MSIAASFRNASFPDVVKPVRANRLIKFQVGKKGSKTESSLPSAMKSNLSLDSSIKSDATGLTDACTECSQDMSLMSYASSPTDPMSRKAPARTRSALKRDTSRRKPGLAIRFNPSVDTRTIISRRYYTEDELDACWFRGDEYAGITRSCCKQIRKLEKGTRLKDLKYCSRGLESHTKQAALTKAQNRRVTWDAVLREQEEQIMLGVVDDEAIAQRYSETASACQLWAIRMAYIDQREAEIVYDEMLDDTFL